MGSFRTEGQRRREHKLPRRLGWSAETGLDRSHYPWQPWARPAFWFGVTTVITFSCYSFLSASLHNWDTALRTQKINVTHCLPHSAYRLLPHSRHHHIWKQGAASVTPMVRDHSAQNEASLVHYAYGPAMSQRKKTLVFYNLGALAQVLAQIYTRTLGLSCYSNSKKCIIS